MRSVLICLAFAVSATAVQAQARPRNVLILIADDLGRQVGCYGDKAIKTPHIDALAKRGTRFENGYATVASCSPSRAAIYTGMQTHSNGQYGLAHAPHHQFSHENVQSLPRLLRLAGYRTGIVAKFHVQPKEAYPFEVEMGKLKSRELAALANAVRGFVKEGGKKPFALVVGFVDPHRADKDFGNKPFVNDPARVKYDPKDMPIPPFLPDTPAVRADLADYYESISRMDRSVGLILEVLRELGQLDDTLVIFLSDNGMPFPGAKTTLYRSGVHLPLIISAPTQQQRGHTQQALVSWTDILPTVLDWTKVKAPAKIQGKSLLPLLDKEDAKGWDAVYGSHQFHEITMYYPMRSITTRRYKLILNLAPALPFPFASDLWGSPSWQDIRQREAKMMGQLPVAQFLQRPREELFDLASDPHELKNLAREPAHAEALTDLRQRLQVWREQTGDPWLILDREGKK